MKFTVDRIEGGFAVIELEGGRWADLPICLAPGIKEGDIISIEILDAETKARKAEMKTKLDNIFEN